MRLRLRFDRNRQSGRVGPFVGILSARYPGPIFGPQTTLFRRMVRAADELQLCAYVFTPVDVDWGRRCVRGYVPHQNGWRRSRFPLPDAVYNRTLSTPAIARCVTLLRSRMGVRVFNARLGSKWSQAHVVRRDPELAPYVPASRRLRTLSDLAAIVAQYGAAYVKPINGAKGAGIWCVERRRYGYDVRYTDGRSRAHGFRTSSLGQVYRAIRRRGGPHLVQRRLHAIRWSGRIADVRALVQKDATGDWQLTGAAVRVGRGSGIVSNLSGGGESRELKEVLDVAFESRPELVKQLLGTVPDVAVRIARHFDRVARPLGELGIDLVIDRDGRIWFLEANSRTGRRTFHNLQPDAAGRTADRRPLEFGAYLAGFGQRTPPDAPS